MIRNYRTARRTTYAALALCAGFVEWRLAAFVRGPLPAATWLLAGISLALPYVVLFRICATATRTYLGAWAIAAPVVAVAALGPLLFEAIAGAAAQAEGFDMRTLCTIATGYLVLAVMLQILVGYFGASRAGAPGV